MSEARARVHAYDLFESLLSGLEVDTIRVHLLEATGDEPTEEEVEVFEDEWHAVRRYLARRRRQIERQVQQQDA